MLNNRKFQNQVRKGWTILVGVVVISLLLSGCNNAAPKVYQVGFLNSTSTSSFQAIFDGFKAKMTELGYVEGKNIKYILQTSKADPDDRLRQTKALADAKVDLIFVTGSPDAVAAQAATQGTSVPVVFAYSQIEGTTLVKSVKEPGGNLTGVRFPGPEMVSRRLELMHEIAPNAKRVWIGYNKNSPNTATALAALRPAAASMGLTLVEVPATKVEDLKADLDARAQSADMGLDAIITMPDEYNATTDNFAVLGKFATEHKLLLGGSVAFMLQQGALFVNSTDLANVGTLAAPVADKILKGTPAGTIPVVTPEQTLMINYKVAQQLGLKVPDGLLSQATNVIR